MEDVICGIERIKSNISLTLNVAPLATVISKPKSLSIGGAKCVFG